MDTSNKVRSRLLAAPVGAVAFSEDGELLLLGAGGGLRVLRFERSAGGGAAWRHAAAEPCLFSHRRVHGIATRAGEEGRVLAAIWGMDSVALVRIGPRAIEIDHKWQGLPDLVWDIAFVDCSASSPRLVAMACARNDVRLVCVSSGRTLATVTGPMAEGLLWCARLACVPAAARGESEGEAAAGITCHVAGGTVLNGIQLWSFTIPGEEQLEQEAAREIVPHETSWSFRAHVGCIFRIAWNASATMLASVSNDRTVRVWDRATQACLAVGWGHITRVWDVLFNRDGNGLVSACENAMVRVWAWDPPSPAADGHEGTPTATQELRCVRTYLGHTLKSVWRVALHPRNALICSAGNDGSVKFWPWRTDDGDRDRSEPDFTERQRMKHLYALERADISVADHSLLSLEQLLPKNGFDALQVDPRGESQHPFVLAATTHVGLCALNTRTRSWTVLDTKAIDAVFAMDWHSGVVACARKDGTVDLLQFRLAEGEEPRAQFVASFFPSALAHGGTPKNKRIRVTAVWWLNACALERALDREDDDDADTDTMLLVTGHLGYVCIWAIPPVYPGTATSQVEPRLVHKYGLVRDHMARCVWLTHRTGRAYSALFIGDRRGTVSIYKFSRRNEPPVADVEQPMPLQCFPRVHQDAKTACFCQWGSSVFSAGHNGVINEFAPLLVSRRHQQEQQLPDADDCHLYVRVNRIHTSPIISIEAICLVPSSPPDAGEPLVEGDTSSDTARSKPAFLVAGYSSKTFMVWDISRRYQLFALGATVWARTHAFAFVSPYTCEGQRVLPSPEGKDDEGGSGEERKDGVQPKRAVSLARFSSLHHTVGSTYPRHLYVEAFGATAPVVRHGGTPGLTVYDSSRPDMTTHADADADSAAAAAAVVAAAAESGRIHPVLCHTLCDSLTNAAAIFHCGNGAGDDGWLASVSEDGHACLAPLRLTIDDHTDASAVWPAETQHGTRLHTHHTTMKDVVVVPSTLPGLGPILLVGGGRLFLAVWRMLCPPTSRPHLRSALDVHSPVALLAAAEMLPSEGDDGLLYRICRSEGFANPAKASAADVRDRRILCVSGASLGPVQHAIAPVVAAMSEAHERLGVCAGNSDGVFSLLELTALDASWPNRQTAAAGRGTESSEYVAALNTMQFHMVATLELDAHPVLSTAMLRTTVGTAAGVCAAATGAATSPAVERVLALAGTNAGNVYIYDVTECFVVPSQRQRPQLLTKYRAHQVGVNALAVRDLMQEKSALLVLSVGDDEAITVCYVCIGPATASTALSEIELQYVHRINGAAASAFKGVQLLGGLHNGTARHDDAVLEFVTVSTDQRVQWWAVDVAGCATAGAHSLRSYAAAAAATADDDTKDDGIAEGERGGEKGGGGDTEKPGQDLAEGGTTVHVGLVHETNAASLVQSWEEGAAHGSGWCPIRPVRNAFTHVTDIQGLSTVARGQVAVIGNGVQLFSAASS